LRPSDWALWLVGCVQRDAIEEEKEAPECLCWTGKNALGRTVGGSLEQLEARGKKGEKEGAKSEKLGVK